MANWAERTRYALPLNGIVQEATAALISMDADRLEELARSCEDLNRESTRTDWASGELDAAGIQGKRQPENRSVSTSVCLETSKPNRSELELLRRILFETKANLDILSELHRNRLAQDC